MTSLAFSRDGRYLAAGASGDALRIWSTSRWRKIASLPHPAAVTGAAFTDRDRHILIKRRSGDHTDLAVPAAEQRQDAWPASGR